MSPFQTSSFDLVTGICSQGLLCDLCIFIHSSNLSCAQQTVTMGGSSQAENYIAHEQIDTEGQFPSSFCKPRILGRSTGLSLAPHGPLLATAAQQRGVSPNVTLRHPEMSVQPVTALAEVIRSIYSGLGPLCSASDGFPVEQFPHTGSINPSSFPLFKGDRA